jgi:hypothetical protein
MNLIQYKLVRFENNTKLCMFIIHCIHPTGHDTPNGLDRLKIHFTLNQINQLKHISNKKCQPSMEK